MFLEDAEISEDNLVAMYRSITAGIDARIKLIKAEFEVYNTYNTDSSKTDTLYDLVESLCRR